MAGPATGFRSVMIDVIEDAEAEHDVTGRHSFDELEDVSLEELVLVGGNVVVLHVRPMFLHQSGFGLDAHHSGGAGLQRREAESTVVAREVEDRCPLDEITIRVDEPEIASVEPIHHRSRLVGLEKSRKVLEESGWIKGSIDHHGFSSVGRLGRALHTTWAATPQRREDACSQ
jgi:hypothetical protein